MSDRTDASQGSNTPLAAVIMAAGKGTRMNDPERAKVLFPLAGRPMIAYVVERALECGAGEVVIVIGYKGEEVRSYVADEFGDAPIGFAQQHRQLGTAHAVLQAEPNLRYFTGNVLVLSGDVPLLSMATLRNLVAHHEAQNAGATVLTVTAPDPTGYGRVIRGGDGDVARVVEHKDASDEERRVDEINSGVYVFDAERLFTMLPKVGSDNAQGEFYLPDVLSIMIGEGETVTAYRSENFGEIQGINNVDQLQQAEEAMLGNA